MGLFFGILHATIMLRPVFSTAKEPICFKFKPKRQKQKSNYDFSSSAILKIGI